MIKKKVLYIDPLSPVGHKKYNEILIKDILSSNAEVYAVSCENYLSQLGISDQNFHVLLEISAHHFKNFNQRKPIMNRIKMIIILNLIRKKVCFSDYDLVVFSSFEEFSFMFTSLPKNCYLISHNNFSNIKNIVKTFILKKLSINQNLVVLSKVLFYKLDKMGIKSRYIPHGLPPQFYCNDSASEYDLKYNLELYDYVLFSPSTASTDYSIIEEMNASSSFVNFINDNKILILIKGLDDGSVGIVRMVGGFLERNEYEYLFENSDAILINYGSDFKNRVSGVYYEAVANFKPVFTSKSFFREIFPLDPYSFPFGSVDELSNLIRTEFHNNTTKEVNRNLKNYEPKFMCKII